MGRAREGPSRAASPGNGLGRHLQSQISPPLSSLCQLPLPQPPTGPEQVGRLSLNAPPAALVWAIVLFRDFGTGHAPETPWLDTKSAQFYTSSLLQHKHLSVYCYLQVIGDQITTIESEPDSSSQDLSRTLPTSSASVNLFYTLATGSGERQARANSSIHSEWSGADSDARHNGRYYSAKQEVKAKVDNRNQKLPILDLSFSEIAQMMDVFGKVCMGMAGCRGIHLGSGYASIIDVPRCVLLSQ